MKKTLMVIAGLLLMTASSWAVPISYNVGGTDVGVQDSLIDHTRLDNSGDQTELDWVQKVLGYTDVTLDTKYDTVGGDWQKTNGTGIWALSLQFDPEYFLIKTGGGGGSDTHYLFNNLDSLSWAVIALSDVNITQIKGVSRISHVDEFKGAPVPEPGTVVLLGCGMLGLGLYARRRIKS